VTQPAAVIVDTNVVVAGLLTASAELPVARLLDAMLSATVRFAVSPALLAEYRAVLVRPQLRRLHGLAVTEVETILTELAQHAIVLTPVQGPAAPDPGDQLLWDLLASRPDLILISGDKRLQRDKAMSGRVVSPAAFPGAA